MEYQVFVHRVVKESKDKKTYIERHTHPFFHCVCGLNGEATVVADENAISMGKHDFVLVSPGIVHSIYTQDGFTSVDIKFYCNEELTALLTQHRFLKSRIDLLLSNYIYDIINEAACKDSFSEGIINAKMLCVLFYVLRESKCVEKGNIVPTVFNGYMHLPSDVRNGVLKHALSYIDAHLNQTIVVSDLAAACGYDSNYFSAIFKKYINCTPNKYINVRKIELAKELLISTEYSITKIANMLGFESIHYFSRVFKSIVGISPKEYGQKLGRALVVNVSGDTRFPPSGEHEFQLLEWDSEAELTHISESSPK